MVKRGVPFFAIFLMAVMLLSCGSWNPPGKETTGSDTGYVSGDGSDSGTLAESDMGADTGETGFLPLASGGKTGYRIISAITSVDGNYAVRNFAERFREKTGAVLPIYLDSDADGLEKIETEILIGNVSSRQESAEIYRGLPYSAYRISIVGKKLCVSMYSDYYLEKGLNLLLESMERSKDGDWGLPAEYSLFRDGCSVSASVPAFETESGRLLGANEGGNENYEVTFTGVATGDWEAYCLKLQATGFTPYQETELSGNHFGTYLSGKTQINISFYPTKRLFKLVYGETGDLPVLEADGGEAVCTPLIFQPGRKGADLSSPNGAPGMSYGLRLPDGRFIMVDGGPGNAEDEAALLAWLREQMPAGSEKPVIAAWFITHAHGDHIQLAINFITKYHDDVEIEAVAYNFPDFGTVTITNENATGMGNLASSFRKLIGLYYPKAKTWVLHTGQRFFIGDAEIEVLYTQEDFAPEAFPWGNHTSCAFRVRLGGKSILFLGDCEKSLCQFMADVYGEELKSDMLQLSHHGYNGACLDLYRYIDPAVCFWASDEYRFLNDPRCLGTASGYDFNAWIRNDSIRVREHYHSSSDTTIFLD